MPGRFLDERQVDDRISTSRAVPRRCTPCSRCIPMPSRPRLATSGRSPKIPFGRSASRERPDRGYDGGTLIANLGFGEVPAPKPTFLGNSLKPRPFPFVTIWRSFDLFVEIEIMPGIEDGSLSREPRDLCAGAALT